MLQVYNILQAADVTPTTQAVTAAKEVLAHAAKVPTTAASGR
jgi:hypothetical protein